MKTQKSIIEVKIDLDPIYGWGNNPQDHVKLLSDYLMKVIPHYHPQVKLITTEGVSND
jgi:hypothetical protein